MSIKSEKKHVTIYLSYEHSMIKINTDTLHLLSFIKEQANKTWQVPRQRQRLYSDGKELTGDSNTLWKVAWDNVALKGKQGVTKTLDKIKNWKITLERVAVRKGSSKVEKHEINIYLTYGDNTITIKTDDSQLLSSVKKKAEATWGIPQGQQHLYSDGKELQGDTKTLWQVAVDTTVAVKGKPCTSKILENIKTWQIRLKRETKLGFKAIEVEHLPNRKRIPWHIDEVLKALNDTRKVIFTLSSKERISEDNKDTSTMVSHAKANRWKLVFDILSKKPYIVNAIPQERAWSVLHQAVFADDSDAVKKLLAIETCDIDIKAKRDWNEDGEAGITPSRLAKKHRCSCASLLSHHKARNPGELEMTLISAESGKTFLTCNLPCYDLACSFLRRDIVASLNLEDGSFLVITEQMYQLLQNNWQYVQGTVAECLYPFDKSKADQLKKARSCHQLMKAMIHIYTGDEVYRPVNAALRRAASTEFPFGDDLLLSLYSLFLTSILLHWKGLDPVQETTYRAISLTDDQAELYHEGETFHWLSFTSSSKSKDKAKQFGEPRDMNVLFIIDNSQNSMWCPRDIKPFSDCPSEEEALYPPCAMFVVTNVEQMYDYSRYSIKLLQPDN